MRTIGADSKTTVRNLIEKILEEKKYSDAWEEILGIDDRDKYDELLAEAVSLFINETDKATAFTIEHIIVPDLRIAQQQHIKYSVGIIKAGGMIKG